MIYKYILGAIIGGVIGGVIGHFGKCASGTCPLTGSPIGGAIFGAFIGALLASAFGGPREVGSPPKELIELKAEADLKEILSRNDVVLVDFYSDRCPPCRKLKPTIHEIATEYAGRAAVVAVNVYDFPGLAQEHGVGGIPDVRVFKGGKVERTLIGLNPKTAYTDALEKLLTANTQKE
ncbi:hypothetical protein HQ563_17125 [bacterium]|nr:hypothetical protein [bacterium]